MAGLGVPRREDLAPARRLEDPIARGIAHAPHLPGDPAPVDVHVDGQGRGRGVVGEAPRFAAALGQREAEASELARDRHLEIRGLPKVLEILREEAVLPVVDGRALVEPVEEVIGQDRSGRVCQGRPPSRERDVSRPSRRAFGTFESTGPDGP